jgi:predicted metal-dependent hydrolase
MANRARPARSRAQARAAREIMPSDLPYRVRRSDRARRVRVLVDPHEGVEVVLPRRSPASAAPAAVAELRPWIESRLAAGQAVRDAVAARGATVPYLGADLVLRPQPGRTRVHRRGDELLVPADRAAARTALERWYRRAAREEIAPRLDEAVAMLGVSYARLTIRNQRTRWGSCSSSGAMSFNWRLLLAPESVLDYVVWHEACHLRVMDHSPNFWMLVRQFCPGYEDDRRWLRAKGNTLVL